MMPQTKTRGVSRMPTLQCLACATNIYLEEDTYANYQGQVTCSECKNQQAVVIQGGALVTASQQRDIYEPVRDLVNHEVPPDILLDLLEATVDLGVNCFKSCVVMCRRSVQAVLLERGVADNKLGRMIDDARGTDILDERLYQTAKAIGFFGNSGAHPLDPELRKVEQLDASLALQVTKRFLQSIYPLRAEEPSAGAAAIGEEG